MIQKELPTGWAYARIDDVTRKGDQRIPAPTEQFIYIDIGSIDRDKKRISEPQILVGSDAPSRARKVVNEGDVIVSLTRPNLNAVAHVDGKYDGQIASTGFEVLKPLLIESKYLFALVRSQAFVDAISGKVQGALYPAAKSSDVRDYEFPLAPLSEQKQIAAKLDELLAQVDTTKTRLDAIPAILKRFRQSVLAAAVSGRLTEEWRKQNGNVSSISLEDVSSKWLSVYENAGKRFKQPSIEPLDRDLSALPNKWISTQIGYVFDVHVGATPSRKETTYWGGKVNWVSSAEVAFCRIKSTKETITDEGLSNSSTSVHPPGTVMLAMIGQGKTRGQPAILDIHACHNQNTAALRVLDDFCVSEYLYYYLAERYEETRRVGSGNNQQAMNKKVVQSLPFPCPPIEEQREIVRLVDQYFAFAGLCEQRVKTAQSRVNHLTQSILAKAFRGELTAEWREQNPDLISGENSAQALLEKIKIEQHALTTKKKTRRKAG